MSASTRPAPPAGTTPAPGPPAGTRRRILLLGAGVVAAAVTVMAVALVAGGGSSPGAALPGLPRSPAVVEWSLPVARALSDLAIIATIGFALLAALLPLRRDALAEDARRALRWSAVAAAAGAVAMTATSILTLADAAFANLSTVLTPSFLRNLGDLSAAYYLLYTALLLLAACAAAAWAAARGGRDAPMAPLVLAAVSLLPIAFTGHASTSRGHVVAIVALGVHLMAVCVWVGGLGALAVYALRRGRALALVLPRYSAVAAVCFAAVGLSGIANAATRLTPGQLFTSSYGALVLGKAVLYAALGALALGQRRRALPALAAATGGAAAQAARRVFARLAVVEVLLMGATVGLAVALSRTPTPAVPLATTPIEALLDFSMPARPTLFRLVFDAWYDPVFSTLGVVAVVLYVGAVVRLHRRGDRWPVGRTVLWITGWSIAVFTTCSGLGRYGAIVFSIHMVQHMLLSMLAPIPMVLAAPITLALRALHPAARGFRGPREWLVAAINSRPMKVIGHPVFGFVLFIASFYGLYFSPLFGYLMAGHVGHTVMNVHFLFAGYLLFWSVIGVDHSPVRLPHLARLVLMLAAAPFHAFFAIALANSTTVIASSWYSELGVPWNTDLLADQHLGGNLTWAFGEIPILLVAVALVFQWIRSDEKDARRHDRRADADGDAELAAYNAYLASLARRDGG